MVGRDDRVDVPAHREVSDDFDVVWIEKVDHVLDDHVRDVFVEDFFISEPVDVELQRLQFDAVLIGNVFNFYRCEIREPAARAKARKLRAREFDRITTNVRAVWETLKLRFIDRDFSVETILNGLYTRS